MDNRHDIFEINVKPSHWKLSCHAPILQNYGYGVCWTSITWAPMTSIFCHVHCIIPSYCWWWTGPLPWVKPEGDGRVPADHSHEYIVCHSKGGHAASPLRPWCGVHICYGLALLAGCGTRALVILQQLQNEFCQHPEWERKQTLPQVRIQTLTPRLCSCQGPSEATSGLLRHRDSRVSHLSNTLIH